MFNCRGFVAWVLLLTSLLSVENKAVQFEATPSTSSATSIFNIARSKILGSSRRARPFVTLSYAQTLDGSIAPSKKQRLDISSPTSFRLLHSLRACNGAVVIGVGTLLSDNPRLNVRDALPGVTIDNSTQPRPVVLDSDLKFLAMQSTMKLHRPIILCCVHNTSSQWKVAHELLAPIGGELAYCERDIAGRCDLGRALEILQRDFRIDSVLLEGGARMIQTALEQQLVDQVVVTVRPCFLGGYRSLTSELPSIASMVRVSAASVGGDIVLHGEIEIEKDNDSDCDSGSRQCKKEEEKGKEELCQDKEEAGMSSLVAVAAAVDLAAEVDGENSESLTLTAENENEYQSLCDAREDITFLTD